MSLIVNFFDALRNSRKRKADGVIRRYDHLVKEAQEYERKREIETASSSR